MVQIRKGINDVSSSGNADRPNVSKAANAAPRLCPLTNKSYPG